MGRSESISTPLSEQYKALVVDLVNAIKAKDFVSAANKMSDIQMVISYEIATTDYSNLDNERKYPGLADFNYFFGDIETDWQEIPYLAAQISDVEPAAAVVADDVEPVASKPVAAEAPVAPENKEKTWIQEYEEKRIALARLTYATQKASDASFAQNFDFFNELLAADEETDIQELIDSNKIDPVDHSIVEKINELVAEINLRIQTESLGDEKEKYDVQRELVGQLKESVRSFEPVLVANKLFTDVVSSYSSILVVRSTFDPGSYDSIDLFEAELKTTTKKLAGITSKIDALDSISTQLDQKERVNFLREVVSRVSRIISNGENEVETSRKLLQDAEYIDFVAEVDKKTELSSLTSEVARPPADVTTSDIDIDRRIDRLKQKLAEFKAAIQADPSFSDAAKEQYLRTDFNGFEKSVTEKAALLQFQMDSNTTYRKLLDLTTKVAAGVSEDELEKIRVEAESYNGQITELESRKDAQLTTYVDTLTKVYYDLLKVTKSKIESERKTSVFKKLEERLEKATQTATYVVDSHHDEVWETYESIQQAYESFAESYGSNEEFEKKLKIEFYKIYRRSMLAALDEIEREEQPSPAWKSIFQDKILGKSQNLVQDIVGISLGSLDDFTEAVKTKGTAGAVTVDTRTLTLHEQNLIEDFNKLRTEYVSRKFLHLSWTANRVGVLGRGEGTRTFPNLNIDENWPIGVVLNYLMKDGLRSSEVGDGQILSEITNPIMEIQRVDHPLGFSTDADGNLVATEGDVALYDASKRGTTKHDVALFEDVFLAMDDWVAGTIKARRGTGDVHNDVDGVAEDIMLFLQKKYPDRKDEITKGDVRRAVRSYLIVTYHQSVRSHRSAILSDKMMYQCSFYLYSEKYSEDGTAGWNPNFVKAMYAYPYPAGSDLSRVDPMYVTKGNYVNTIPVILGEHPDIDAEKHWIFRVLEGKPFTQMENALRDEGFLVDMQTAFNHSDGRPKTFAELDPKIQARLEEDHFVGYNFLLRPLIRMADTTQTARTKDVILDTPDPVTGKHYRRETVPDEKDAGEMYTQMPPMATVFLKDKNGNIIRYREKDGRKTRAVSLFDLRNENDQIMYGLIDWDKYSIDLASEVTGLHKNGANFLDNFLKTKDVLKSLEDPAKVSELLNDAKYVLRHLPDLGQYIAAGIHATDEVKAQGYDSPYYMLDKGFMRTIIAQMVFHGCLARMLSDEKPWRMADVQSYLIKLLRPESNAISVETAEAIYISLNAALGRKAMVKAVVDQARVQFRERFKHS
ncbi:MAG: hypothetical protein GW762_06090 [Candidatus Pacebacteria bacterium]|nr:hypothetical protein [Candidatus Paceibacterota bacterium]